MGNANGFLVCLPKSSERIRQAITLCAAPLHLPLTGFRTSADNACFHGFCSPCPCCEAYVRFCWSQKSNGITSFRGPSLHLLGSRKAHKKNPTQKVSDNPLDDQGHPAGAQAKMPFSAKHSKQQELPGTPAGRPLFVQHTWEVSLGHFLILCFFLTAVMERTFETRAFLLSILPATLSSRGFSKEHQEKSVFVGNEKSAQNPGRPTQMPGTSPPLPA